jgi:hypothetical protein
MSDPDAESMEDLESALKISINKALSYIWNLQPWSFRKETSNIKTKPGRANYTLPNGIIEKKTVNGVEKFGVIYGKKNLEYMEDYDYQEDKEGEPEYFYIDGENLYIYPTPDNIYQIKVKYLSLPPCYNVEEEEVFELTNEDDYLKVPDKYEKLFRNCIISLAMIYAIADENDENHSGYMRQYEDSLKTLMKYCSTKIVDKNIVW